jgi:two-component system nitrogen regulation response regulator GlnG
VRIIAATNRNLDDLVGKGEFRPDLYYRLNGFSIELPPLRERTEDIVVLLEHFLHRFSRGLGKDVCEVSPEALEIMMRYRWPGNVREFQSVLKQALLQAIGSVLLPEFLPPAVRIAAGETNGEIELKPGEIAALEDFIDERIQARSIDLYAEVLAYVDRIVLTRVLRHTGANQSTAAKILGITRGSLRNKIRTLGIRIDQVVNLADQPPAKLPRSLEAVG